MTTRPLGSWAQDTGTLVESSGSWGERRQSRREGSGQPASCPHPLLFLFFGSSSHRDRGPAQGLSLRLGTQALRSRNTGSHGETLLTAAKGPPARVARSSSQRVGPWGQHKAPGPCGTQKGKREVLGKLLSPVSAFNPTALPYLGCPQAEGTDTAADWRVHRQEVDKPRHVRRAVTAPPAAGTPQSFPPPSCRPADALPFADFSSPRKGASLRCLPSARRTRGAHSRLLHTRPRQHTGAQRGQGTRERRGPQESPAASARGQHGGGGTVLFRCPHQLGTAGSHGDSVNFEEPPS